MTEPEKAEIVWQGIADPQFDALWDSMTCDRCERSLLLHVILDPVIFPAVGLCKFWKRDPMADLLKTIRESP
jgi:hypothetical protein